MLYQQSITNCQVGGVVSQLLRGPAIQLPQNLGWKFHFTRIYWVNSRCRSHKALNSSVSMSLTHGSVGAAGQDAWAHVTPDCGSSDAHQGVSELKRYPRWR